ncbi:MAG: hypothetical protein KC416_04750 [Myxococcales bacterium]|nr:hypothetical protein [Myxococcales bacterium]
MHNRNALLAAALFSFFGCAADHSGDGTNTERVPCGIRPCSASDTELDRDIPDYDGTLIGGKADAADVEGAIARSAADGVLDATDIELAFESAGEDITSLEMLVIRDALESTSWEVTDDARTTALNLAFTANLFDYEARALTGGAPRTVGRHNIPDAVLALVAKARLNGALAFDVREEDEDGEGVWSPYPTTTPPTENMTFEYTEITPQVLEDDMNDRSVEYNAIVGTEKAEWCNGGNCMDYERARYDARRGGTGNVMAHYDHVFHEDLYARGSQGQKWANNCAILYDGSLHCLPAARRSELQDVILTNPHLSRCTSDRQYPDSCKHLLYNGHIDIREGVVTGVEMSGRLSKRAGQGRAIFIDPVAVLEAWGFENSPNVRLRYGNTSRGTPIQDTEQGVVRAAD